MDINSLFIRFRTYFRNIPPRQQKKLILFALLGIFIIIMFIKGCLAIVINKQKVSAEPLLIRVNNTIKIPESSPLRSHLLIKTVTTSTAPHIVKFPGIVEADQSSTITILPPVTGRIIRLETKLGDVVKKGQVLAVMQSSALAQAYTDKIKAQSALQQASDALQRTQKVNRAGGSSIKDLQQQQNNYTQAQAEMQRAQATLNALGNNQKEHLEIQAPIDGKIIALNYGVGSYINDPTRELFTLSNIQSVWVTACIPEHLIAKVAKGQKVDVILSAYPQQTWKGSIAFVNNMIDADARCNKSRIAIANSDEKLQPNMFASIHAKIPQEEQIIVPLSSILMNNDNTSVFIETAPWIFTRRTVVLGTEDGNHVRILSGLKAGDRIVAAGGILVND
ncbi:cation efflux system protein [Legionella moravica]|uniref:Cation efflux system protein n=1 Tax=Legionella moravica TaxID=39962 RepID=A0A378JW34_9GAMM|nr:efflux RND transporter periplasmic adaptor subunit [Legionella moravica]KTD35674.1 cation efflux system protein [Legionella moravica]STX62804.1 cation efflux system protein [Legionella moravica]